MMSRRKTGHSVTFDDRRTHPSKQCLGLPRAATGLRSIHLGRRTRAASNASDGYVRRQDCAARRLIQASKTLDWQESRSRTAKQDVRSAESLIGIARLRGSVDEIAAASKTKIATVRI
jgi:hypothetical protein